MCEKYKEDKFHTRLINDDETASVETEFTLGELEETLKIVTNAAIQDHDPAALKIASLFAFIAKQFEDAVEARSIMQTRFEAFREAVQKIQKLPSGDIKEVLDSLLSADERLSVILSRNDEFI